MSEAAGEMKNKAKLSLNWDWDLTELGNIPTQYRVFIWWLIKDYGYCTGQDATYQILHIIYVGQVKNFYYLKIK